MRDWNYDNDQWMKLPVHIRHLPLFTRHFDFTSFIFRVLWAIYLKFTFTFYIRLQVKGSFKPLWQTHPRLLLISNHASHLDAVSIAAAVPFKYWRHLYISAAKDYWFKNPLFTFFSKHCLGAIPIDRKDRSGEAVRLCTTLLNNFPRVWLILFPEGTRSKDGYINMFKRGVSLFAERTETPILFLYLEGNSALWPKGRLLPLPGKLIVHVGPVHPPAPVDEIYTAYRDWILGINPNAFRPESKLENEKISLSGENDDTSDRADNNEEFLD